VARVGLQHCIDCRGDPQRQRIALIDGKVPVIEGLIVLEALGVFGLEALDATVRSSRVSRAFQTSPMPPTPMGDRI